MTAQQINAALTQAKNIISMMSKDERAKFTALDQEAQFKFMCAFLAATA